MAVSIKLYISRGNYSLPCPQYVPFIFVWMRWWRGRGRRSWGGVGSGWRGGQVGGPLYGGVHTSTQAVFGVTVWGVHEAQEVWPSDSFFVQQSEKKKSENLTHLSTPTSNHPSFTFDYWCNDNFLSSLAKQIRFNEQNKTKQNKKNPMDKHHKRFHFCINKRHFWTLCTIPHLCSQSWAPIIGQTG